MVDISLAPGPEPDAGVSRNPDGKVESSITLEVSSYVMKDVVVAGVSRLVAVKVETEDCESGGIFMSSDSGVDASTDVVDSSRDGKVLTASGGSGPSVTVDESTGGGVF